MILLPFENITYKTKLDSAEVLNRIAEITDKSRTPSFSRSQERSDHKRYEGTIKGNQFSLNRIIKYRNSFLPKISGVVKDEYNYRTVKIKMELHVVVIIFMSFWFGILGIGIISSLLNQENGNQIDWTLLLMILFVYGLIMGGFKFESIPSKKYFAKLLEAEFE